MYLLAKFGGHRFYRNGDMKWNGMKWNTFFLIKFTTISGKNLKTKHKETDKLSNIHDKKMQTKKNCEQMP